ncbi:unnamed protein product [Cylindrotheca closterium]|uniref:Bulb-type lectin domain-containing protein n=1 Tax=Cylindrotheca closterium TaxID=2856 RepID=A0AAD2FJ60_9STRA|nr:unnamed protein product [Cylindrotheca closterium]
MRIVATQCLLSCLLILLSNFNLVQAESKKKLRRGSVNENDEIEDMSSSDTTTGDESLGTTTRSLSYSTMTDAEIFALQKTPPYPLGNSKCGYSSPKQHPGCTRGVASSPQPTPPLPTTSLPKLPTDAPASSAPSISPSMVPTTSEPTVFVPSSSPTAVPTKLADRPLNCVQAVQGEELTISSTATFRQGEVHCLSVDGQEAYFGYTWTNQFGLFVNGETVWTAPEDQVNASFERWSLQGDGNLVLRDSNNNAIWRTGTCCHNGSQLKVSMERVWIESSRGSQLWSEPFFVTQTPSLTPTSQPTGPPTPTPTLAPSLSPTPLPTGLPTPPPTPSPTVEPPPTPPPTTPPTFEKPDPYSGLQYYAYYYPWYIRNDWSRHGYQDEPLLGKYGTDEVAVAEQHIQWALETGISSWVVSWWGADRLAMKHFKKGMMNAPSLNKIKFCMLYESMILEGRGNWYDGSKEEALFQHLKTIRDEFFDHPSYLKINGRPVIIFYITRSRMMFQTGFDGPSILANMRRRLGYDIYFIADEPFFDPYNKRPDGNENAFKDGKQVFDAYTTYNMFIDSKVRPGETATDYQLREGMPIWQEWAKKVPMFPNVMAQYYDFRGHKPLLGNSDAFMRQLREVACLPRTNFNGAPHIMFITSFNEWWEGTQIGPENGSSNNWNNYGFQFMETLAEFKMEIDSRGSYWC